MVVLATGGTIAGVSPSGDDRAYQAAQLGVEQLLAAVPALSCVTVQSEQVAQVDSKDMGWTVWRALVETVLQHLARPEVAGVVITHGTDTLEETALLLHLLLPAGKPVLLTAAMRPATSGQADGPTNLLHAVLAVSRSCPCGVGVMLQGRLWSARDIRKAHSWHIDAFDGGGLAPLAQWDDGSAGLVWAGIPACFPLGWVSPSLMRLDHLPRVEIVTSHADADGAQVDGLLVAGRAGRPLRGLVVACTGHGTLHRDLREALRRAGQAGVQVWLSTRVARGGVPAKDLLDAWPGAGLLTPAQARVALALALAARPALSSQPWESWPSALDGINEPA